MANISLSQAVRYNFLMLEVFALEEMALLVGAVGEMRERLASALRRLKWQDQDQLGQILRTRDGEPTVDIAECLR